MTTPSLCSNSPPAIEGLRTSPPPQSEKAARCAARRRKQRGAVAAVVLLLAGGCGFTQGKLLYLMGVGRGQLVKAEFPLTSSPILVLVDDPSGRVDWPPALRYLADDLSQELIHQRAAEKIIPQQTLDQLRQTVPVFAHRGCREVGELAQADQVLWVEVRDFLADELISDPSVAAYYSVTVKVIDVLEEKRRSRVRLWPQSPQGRLATVTLNGSEVARRKTKDAISRELSAQLAQTIAKFFYEHRLGDFETKK